MGWVVVEKYKEKGDLLEKEHKRWLNVAEDVGLFADERNVRVVEANGEYRVEISEEMNDFFHVGQ